MQFPQNDYPNYTNFPFPSFPQEVPPPSVDPDDGDMICVTYAREWTAVLMSACDQLIQLSSWSGDDDTKKLTANRATILKILLQTDIGCDMSGCCHELVEHRVTADGTIEMRIDGGDWVTDPADPRLTAALMPPITFDDHTTKCDAASNVAIHLDDVISSTSDQLGGTGSLIEIASVIVLAIFGFFLVPESIPVLAPLVLPLLSAILFLGQAGFDAYFDDGNRHIILCAIYCAIGDDGTFTDTQYADLISRLNSDLSASPAKDYFVQIVGRIGLVGINNYASIGTSHDADCSDCGCVDCDITNWTEVVGNSMTFIGTNTVDIVATNGHGDANYYAGIVAPTDSADCHFFGVTVLSGTIFTGGDLRSWSLCGEGPVATHVSGLVPPGDTTCYRTLYYISSTPFTVRFTCLGDCTP
jgi:hypothetical protein